MRQINRLAGSASSPSSLAGCLFGTDRAPRPRRAGHHAARVGPPQLRRRHRALSRFRPMRSARSAATFRWSRTPPSARAQIVDVRVGTHADYDRVVFEFADGLPEISLDRATPPFTQDASGLPIDVEGTSFLRLTMRGGTKQTEDGTSSYDGPTDFDPGFPMLVDLAEGGDFEAQSTWYLGLNGEACPRVTLLTEDGAPRLVIDVES